MKPSERKNESMRVQASFNLSPSAEQWISISFEARMATPRCELESQNVQYFYDTRKALYKAAETVTQVK